MTTTRNPAALHLYAIEFGDTYAPMDYNGTSSQFAYEHAAELATYIHNQLNEALAEVKRRKHANEGDLQWLAHLTAGLTAARALATDDAAAADRR
jgi:hypothetical protein